MWVTASHRSTSRPKVKKEVKKDKVVEPKTPPVVGAGSPVRQDPVLPKREDKKINQPKPYRKITYPKTTLEILMEDD